MIAEKTPHGTKIRHKQEIRVSGTDIVEMVAEWAVAAEDGECCGHMADTLERAAARIREKYVRSHLNHVGHGIASKNV